MSHIVIHRHVGYLVSTWVQYDAESSEMQPTAEHEC